MEGYDRATIEERYEGRYGPEGRVELAVADAPSRGAADAPVTLVEFSDFECPHCGRAHGILNELLGAHPDVRLVFKHCPLLMHPRAVPAARAAEAARTQGKFWEMHDLLFEHQRALEDADLEGYARQLGLDLERFRADLASPEVHARVEADRDEAARVGVQGTPTIFVNGRRFEESLETLEAYVKEALVP
jgi:protein-disulfide isomerase